MTFPRVLAALAAFPLSCLACCKADEPCCIRDAPVIEMRERSWPTRNHVRLESPPTIGAPSGEAVSAQNQSAELSPLLLWPDDQAGGVSPDKPNASAQPAEATFPLIEPSYESYDPYGSRRCRSSPSDVAQNAIERVSWDRSCDNLYFFQIGEAFRLTDQSTRAAARAGLNWGLPIINDGSGLGFQFGFSGSWAEEAPQWFLTSGVFYRGDMRCDWAWNLGIAFDFMQDDELHADVGQVRGKTSITLDRKNEIGLWGAISVLEDDTRSHTKVIDPGNTVVLVEHNVDSTDQVNGFYTYLFESGTELTGWAGWRSDPSSFAMGMTTYTPINDRWAGIFGMYYAFHGDSWNVYTGLVRHWGDRARRDYLGQDRHQPYLPVADNTSMTLVETEK